MNFLDKMSDGGKYFILSSILCLIVLSFLFCILFIILFNKNRKLRRILNQFMEGADGKSLESAILSKFQVIDVLYEDNQKIKKNIDSILETLTSIYQYVSLLKYDAFREMGGKLSFSLCMLDAKKNGFILSSMHNSREGCYTYIKEIINGESYVLLSEEEKNVLQQAKEKALGLNK